MTSAATKGKSGQSGKKAAGGARSAARLAAVQVLYQTEMEHPELTIDRAVDQFVEHRLGEVIDGIELVRANADFFADIAKGGWGRRREWDNTLILFLAEGWTVNRLNALTRAILRCACYELAARIDVPRGAIINEYLDVAHAFHDRSEVSFINGILDQLANRLRGNK